ncbi:MAG: VTT domain-containing protein [Candidatus Liptonbacteria bacterium]|nr:VTT domain-containing protein [Candidatus Liptonbacteria bacterium]
MDAISFAATTDWVLSHGYVVMFFGMLVWGPPVTAAGAFGAALGYFNLWVVFALSLATNLLGDAVFYAIGFWGHQEFIARYGKYVGITHSRLKVSKKLLTENLGKAMTISKLVPLLALPGLVTAGVVKVPLRPYIWWAIVIAVPSSLVYLLVGYYFGAAYDTAERYLRLGGIVIAALILVFAAGLRLLERLSERIEKETGE